MSGRVKNRFKQLMDFSEGHNRSPFHLNAAKLAESTLWNKVRPQLRKHKINILQTCSYIFRSILSNRAFSTLFSVIYGF